MKHYLTLAAMAATLLLGASCKKEAVTPVAGEGDVLRTISVNLGDPASKASTALSGEGAIEDATLFVWQHNAETDETTLYQKAYAEASTFEFSLLFSDQTEYTYSINAWANMGELDAEPSDGEVLFIGEEASGLQMKGSRSGIDQASASAVTIDMKRYVGKITVAEVALEWTNDQNALQDFTLKSIYIANAGDKAEGAVATYNVDGVYASSAMDEMLYSPVNSVIADGAGYGTAQIMYAYGSGSTAIVLECDLGGQTMYYHVDYEPDWNTHRVFRFTVRQAGSDSPLGDLPEEALEVTVTTLNVLDFDQSESEMSFGEKPVYSGIGAAVLFDDGTYEITDITKRLHTNPFSQAVGVCVGDGVHSFVLNSKWIINSDYSTFLSLESDWTVADPNLDFSGYDNFEKMKSPFFDDLNQFLLANISNQNPARNGNFPYIPSVGELLLVCKYRDQINEYLSLLGYSNSTLLPSYFSYLSSTPHPDGSYYVVEMSARGEILLHSSDETSFGLCFCVGNHSALKGCAYYIRNENPYNSSNLILPGYGNLSDELLFVVGDGIRVVALSLGGKSCAPWSTSDFLVDGVFTTQDRETALSEFAGKENTEAIMYALNQGLAEFPWTSQFFYGGYLPSVGELVLFLEYWDEFAESMKHFYDIDINNEGNFHYLWTSTQYSADKVWAYVENDFVPIDKSSSRLYTAFECLPFEFSYD